MGEMERKRLLILCASTGKQPALQTYSGVNVPVYRSFT